MSLAEQTGADHGILFKPKNDPRVTPFGHFIRKTSLDEFPQFFNVFIGNMSLVGPRPQQRYEVEQYGTLYSSRLLVKPGITGLWQISGRSDLSQEEAEHLDVSYIQNWSITGDLAILLKTVSVVIRGTGSY
ncbi:sugar transferase [Bifidobacterium mongoliense]